MLFFQHMKDKFWNFIFYKFIFVFGIVNVQYLHEIVLWVGWFTAIGFLHLMAQLCKDRFEYVGFTFSMQYIQLLFKLKYN
jgi:E3 ubiquitin-protein ligase AMFR